SRQPACARARAGGAIGYQSALRRRLGSETVAGRSALRPGRVCPLFGLGDLDGAEAFERAVDEEDLHRDVGLDVGLAEEREDLAAGELFDRLSVSRGHHALEVL